MSRLWRRHAQQATKDNHHGKAVGNVEKCLQRESKACETRPRTTLTRHRPRHAGRPGLVPGKKHKIIHVSFLTYFLTEFK